MRRSSTRRERESESANASMRADTPTLFICQGLVYTYGRNGQAKARTVSGGASVVIVCFYYPRKAMRTDGLAMTSPRRPSMGRRYCVGSAIFCAAVEGRTGNNCGLSGRRPAAGAAGYYHNANMTAWPGRTLALGGICVGGRAV